MVYWGVGPSYIGMNSSVPGMLWSSWKVTPGSDYKSAEPYWSSGYQSSAATLSSSLQLIASGVGGAGQLGSTSSSSSTESAPARRASPSWWWLSLDQAPVNVSPFLVLAGITLGFTATGYTDGAGLGTIVEVEPPEVHPPVAGTVAVRRLVGATGLVERLILGVIGRPRRLSWMLELEPEVEGWGRGLVVFLGFVVRGLGRVLMGSAVPELHPPVAGAEVFGLNFLGVDVGLTGAGVGATITAASSEVHPPVAGGAVILRVGLTTAGAGLTMGFTIFMGGTSSVGPLLQLWVPELFLDLSSATGSFTLG